MIMVDGHAQYEETEEPFRRRDQKIAFISSLILLYKSIGNNYVNQFLRKEMGICYILHIRVLLSFSY